MIYVHVQVTYFRTWHFIVSCQAVCRREHVLLEHSTQPIRFHRILSIGHSSAQSLFHRHVRSLLSLLHASNGSQSPHRQPYHQPLIITTHGSSPTPSSSSLSSPWAPSSSSFSSSSSMIPLSFSTIPSHPILSHHITSTTCSHPQNSPHSGAMKNLSPKHDIYKSNAK